jgi:hypothetical protein
MQQFFEFNAMRLRCRGSIFAARKFALESIRFEDRLARHVGAVTVLFAHKLRAKEMMWLRVQEL